MISKPSAGALSQRILPPTLNVDTPTSQVDWKKSPCYINSKTRTWIHSKTPSTIPKSDQAKWARYSSPRRAAVSAFGFGGVNAHAVLEEHDDDYENETESLLLEWETELCLFVGKTHEELLKALTEVQNYLGNNPSQALRNVAFALATKARKMQGEKQTVSIVASTVVDLQKKIDGVLEALGANKSPQLSDVYYVKDSTVGKGKLAFVMPGLGAAYPNMLQDLCFHFPEVRIVFDFIDMLALQMRKRFHAEPQNFPKRRSSAGIHLHR